MSTFTTTFLNLITVKPTIPISATKTLSTNLSVTPLNPKPRITFSQTPIFLSPKIHKPLPKAIGPGFLAGIETSSLNVPATHLATGIAKWLDLYAHILTVRILLGWFPTIPWKNQPFSAVRSLSDPYLNLFRNLVPSSGTLDFSSIIGFMILATLSNILNTNKPPF